MPYHVAMYWQLQLFALFAAVAAILTVGYFLDLMMKTDSKDYLGKFLRKTVDKTPESWLQLASGKFSEGFDKIYGGSSSNLELVIWLGLVLSPLTLALTRIPFVSGASKPEDLLIIAMLGAFGYVLIGYVTLVVGNAGAMIGIALWGRYVNAIGTLAVVFIGIFIAIIFGVIFGGIYGGTIGGKFSIVTGVIFGGIAGGIIIALAVKVWRIPIHPLKAMFWSVVFACIFGLIAWDTGKAFVIEIYTDPKVLAFVAFNFFADGVSLLETRWVLCRGSSASLGMLASLVIFDLVASAAIYLVLPTILWPQILEIGDAMLFRGNRPWLRILFWTTFSTSFMFYLFVAAALLVRPLTRGLGLFDMLSGQFDLQANPVWCLAVAMAVVVTVLFLAGGIIQAA